MRPGTKKTISILCIFLAVWVGIRYLLPVSMPFLLGLGLALAAEPMVGFFSGKLRLPRAVSAGIGVSMTFACIALLILIFCAFLVRELGTLAGILPNLEGAVKSGIVRLENWLLELTALAPPGIASLLSQNVTDFFSSGTALLDRAMRYLLGLAGGMLSHVPDSALGLGTAVISGFMISAKLPRIKKWIAQRLPQGKLRPLLDALKRMKTAVGGWLLAQLKLAGVTFAILTAGFLILRIHYAPLWALAIAVVDAFPVLGTGTVLIPWSLVCFLQGDGARAIGLIGTYIVVCLTRSALEPKLVGRQLGLDPLVTLIALYAGYKIWGIGGMILAPLLAVTAMHLVSAGSAGPTANS